MKIVKYIAGFLIVIIALLVATPFLFKSKIVELIKQQANKQVNATINFDNNIGLSLIKTFPDFGLTINNLQVVGINEFSADTLLQLKSFSAALDIISVIKGGSIQINEITLVEPTIHAIVLKDGKANWDIAKPSADSLSTVADTTVSAFNVKLKRFAVTNATISYNDLNGGTFAAVKDLNYTLTGDFSQDEFTIENLLDIAGVTVKMDGISFLNNVAVKANANIDANLTKQSFLFKENTLQLNALLLAFNGGVNLLEDGMLLDLSFDVKENTFKNFLSLIPAIYKADLNKLDAKGNLAFNGFAKGVLNENNYPAFGLKVGINQGWFKHADMPTAMEKVNLDLNIEKPEGNLDLLTVNLKELAFSIKNNPFFMKLMVTKPMTDPNIDFIADGSINFDHLGALVPLPGGTTLTGLLIADVFAKGAVSTITNKKYEQFNTGGKILINNMKYAAADLPKSLHIIKADMAITPKAYALNDLQIKIGNSDMQLNGKVVDFLPYVFNNGVLIASLNLNSSTLDANEWLSNENETTQTAAATDTASLSVIEIPANIDFTFSSNINKLLYTNMVIEDFKGMVTVKNSRLSFNEVALKTLGSSMKMDGYYSTENPKEPIADIHFKINNLDIQKSFETFNTVQKLAPAAQNIAGFFNASFNLTTPLTQNMQPQMTALVANGFIEIPNATISKIKSIDKIADLFNKPEYKQASVNNAKIKFNVVNGRINTEPFDLKFGKQLVSLGGSTGLDQTIDYIGKTVVNKNDLGVANQAINQALAQLNQALGSNIKTSDQINLGITIGGTFSNPIIGTNLADLAKNEAKSLTNQLADEAAKRKAELEAKARAEADKLRNEAEAKAAAAKAEAERIKRETEAKARAETDRLKKEVEAKAQAEKERLKKQAEEEAKKKIRGLF